MDKTGFAFFVDFPRTIEDLKQPHEITQEHEYEVVKTVWLRSIDYQNFITDMLADRQFIEDNCHLCSEGELWSCLLVRSEGAKDGILVMPADRCYVKYAACLEL